MRKMFFKPKHLAFILSGKKDLEGRVGYDNIKTIETGETLSLNGIYKAKVVERSQYPTFREAVTADNYKRLIPDARSPEDAIRTYEKIYPPWKQEKLGVYIFELKVLGK